jgi:S-adenosylmethionine:tRNA ribosyltransferase-isomerase
MRWVVMAGDRSLPRVRLEDLDYDLDPALIAQVPVEPGNRHVRDLPVLLAPGDLVVVNDTRVIPARLRLRRATGGASEVLLLEPCEPSQRQWEALVKPARKLPPGSQLHDPSGKAVVEVGRRTASGDTFVVTLLGDDDPLDVLAALGEMPLPPYIHAAPDDPERYQTVFARRPASAAAPTAGLHLTTDVLAALSASGIASATVELVVGLDTFAPITEGDPLTHRSSRRGRRPVRRGASWRSGRPPRAPSRRSAPRARSPAAPTCSCTPAETSPSSTC